MPRRNNKPFRISDLTKDTTMNKDSHLPPLHWKTYLGQTIAGMIPDDYYALQAENRRNKKIRQNYFQSLFNGTSGTSGTSNQKRKRSSPPSQPPKPFALPALPKRKVHRPENKPEPIRDERGRFAKAESSSSDDSSSDEDEKPRAKKATLPKVTLAKRPWHDDTDDGSSDENEKPTPAKKATAAKKAKSSSSDDSSDEDEKPAAKKATLAKATPAKKAKSSSSDDSSSDEDEKPAAKKATLPKATLAKKAKSSSSDDSSDDDEKPTPAKKATTAKKAESSSSEDSNDEEEEHDIPDLDLEPEFTPTPAKEAKVAKKAESSSSEDSSDDEDEKPKTIGKLPDVPIGYKVEPIFTTSQEEHDVGLEPENIEKEVQINYYKKIAKNSEDKYSLAKKKLEDVESKMDEVASALKDAKAENTQLKKKLAIQEVRIAELESKPSSDTLIYENQQLQKEIKRQYELNAKMVKEVKKKTKARGKEPLWLYVLDEV